MATIDPAALAALAVDDADKDDAFEALRSRAAGMVNKMMSEAERVLEVGTPSDKAQFVKQVLPAILKTLQDKKEGDDLAELRQAQADLMSDVRKALLSGQPADVEGVREVPADTAPGVGAAAGDSDVRTTARRTAAKKPPVKKAPRGRPRNST